MAEQGRTGEGAAIARIVENLLERFIAGKPAGTWTEHLSPDGAAKGDRIPASTLYHIVLAFSELERIFGETTRAPERA